ncbi:HlyD family type I secretion periplasmic adaptor subunit [Aliiroseovarius zhejiangensis]|uniref:Membrane fusion protein (MFP) family protein n=1 Tax=Aliiroseovarius zhejiangensis TaxID=1632025 RepID=A0ABQ3IP62_9RHOB|nr:HlyD family type I secretion periplasmic adaptor subunit [Aliiroseovarius zhejiangensis]GHE89317.1 HlyD family type I secretion periplasmic adaptor subunit [Aliiroseovarius zhejiangensis]
MTQSNLPANAVVIHEWHDKVPRSIKKHVMFGLLLLVVTFGGFGAWAFRAPLAAAVIAQGSFVATGRNKIVQHLEGGIIHEILVREGDEVSAGDVLLTLDETAALANRRELHIRKARLEATVTRLAAEYRELEQLDFPQQLLDEASQDQEIASILDGQRLSFSTARASLNNDVSLLERNINALEIRKTGYQIQHDSHVKMVELLDQEYADKSKLLSGGLIRQTEVNALLRAKIEAQGQIGRLQAEVNENEQLMLKHQTQIEKVRSLYRENALDELQVIQAELESVREKYRKAENVLTRSEVTAPVSGTILRLHYFTPGGVIETGKPIAEILPSSAPLIVETLILRTDIDSVHRGQNAVVRLTGLNARTTPVLDGTVDYVSADAIADNANGVTREVFVARVTLSPEELARVKGFVPTPGMPAEVMIQTAERTFAQYIARPLADSMARAFREQ